LHAIESPGAPRTLRFTWEGGTTANVAETSLSQPAVGLAREGAAGGSELYFTRTARGTRNLWRAPIKFEAAPVITPASDDSADSTEIGSTQVARRLRTARITEKPLVAQAITKLAAPLFAESAVPLSTTDFCFAQPMPRADPPTRRALLSKLLKLHSAARSPGSICAADVLPRSPALKCAVTRRRFLPTANAWLLSCSAPASNQFTWHALDESGNFIARHVALWP
jgi:hypothetical protein